MPRKAAAWLAAHEAQFHLATVTLAEISEGIAQRRRSGAERRADEYRRWLFDILARFAYRVLPLTIEAALSAGEMADAATARGRHPGLADIFIAATVKSFSLTVVTRNVKHFDPLDVPYINPFDLK
jgi:predicted nucleic acid-binding protein